MSFAGARPTATARVDTGSLVCAPSTISSNMPAPVVVPRTRYTNVMVSLLALAAAVAAPCPAVDIERWTGDLRGAEDAFGALDEAGFDRRMEEAGASLPCLSEAVSPSLAADYH